MNNSYWDQFESHEDSNTNNDDFWNQFESHEKPSKLKKTGRIATQFGLGLAENALFPYEMAASVETSPSVRNIRHREDIAEELEQLGSKKRKGSITPEEDKQLQMLLQQIKDPLSTLSQFKEQTGGVRGVLEKISGENLEPEGLTENIANFSAFIKNPKKIIQEAIKKGKLLPRSKEAKEILDLGRKYGLTDKQLAPLLHSSKKSNLLGTAGLRTKRSGEALKESEDALGSIYDYLLESGKKMPAASRSQQAVLFKKFDDVAERIRLSGAKSPDEKAALSMIDEMIHDFSGNGIDPARIIATWQSINKSVNWNSIKGGKKMLSKLKQPMEDLFTEIAPKEAADFKMVNKAYGKLKDISSHIGPKKISDMEKIAKWGPFGTALWKLVTTGNPKVLAGVATAHGAQLLATEMLINPNLNGLMQKTLGNLSKATKPMVKKGILDLKKGLEKYPEIYNEFDWNSLDEI